MSSNPLADINGQLMIMCAHSYCLGRQTYVVGTCVDWIIAHLDWLTTNTRQVIARDTLVAIARDCAGSRTIDVPVWRKLLETIWVTLGPVSRDSILDYVYAVTQTSEEFDGIVKELPGVIDAEAHLST
jgi:hypothetical protein